MHKSLYAVSCMLNLASRPFLSSPNYHRQLLKSGHTIIRPLQNPPPNHSLSWHETVAQIQIYIFRSTGGEIDNYHVFDLSMSIHIDFWPCQVWLTSCIAFHQIVFSCFNQPRVQKILITPRILKNPSPLDFKFILESIHFNFWIQMLPPSLLYYRHIYSHRPKFQLVLVF
jgi:hypothetical protein